MKTLVIINIYSITKNNNVLITAVAESRENIPLQNGRKTAGFCSEEYFSGTKFINVAFGSLTVIITVALLIQIYYGDYQVNRIRGICVF